MAMKIGITTFGCDLRSGMSRYISSLIRQFATAPGDDTFELLVHDSTKQHYQNNSDRVALVSVPEWLRNPVLNIGWHQTVLPTFCKQKKYDVLFLPAASRRSPIWAPCVTVGTVHDLTPFHMAEKYDRWRTSYQTRVLPHLLNRLKHIITVSESTKRDVMMYAGVPEDRITVIHHAADTDIFFPHDRDMATHKVRAYGIGGPYIIYTSRIEHPGKNHVRLIRAFEALKRRKTIPHQLVLTGADWMRADEVHRAATLSSCADDILFTGFVRDKDLPDLYCAADMLVFPSLFEGFGLPILEAMACGVPVACSNISSMPEIAGDAAVLFDPTDVDSIAQAILTVLSSEDRRIEISKKGLLRARCFSWEQTAQKTLDVIHEVAGL